MFTCTILGLGAYLVSKFLHLEGPLEKMVEHVLGSSTHEFLKESLEAFPERFESGGLPPNHDLRKASLHSLRDA